MSHAMCRHTFSVRNKKYKEIAHIYVHVRLGVFKPYDVIMGSFNFIRAALLLLTCSSCGADMLCSDTSALSTNERACNKLL